MPRPSGVSAFEFPQEILQAYALNDRMNQVLLADLDPRAWRARNFGHKGRTIAAIFAHVHNIRCKWLRLSAPHLKLPARLDHDRCTQKQTRAALAESAERCSQMLAEALSKRHRPRPEFCARWLGQTMASGRCHVCLHDYA